MATKPKKPAPRPPRAPAKKEKKTTKPASSRATTLTKTPKTRKPVHRTTKLMKDGKPTRGAPTKFQEEYSDQAYKLTLLGWDDKQLADFFLVSEVTLNAWKHAHPEFLKSITRGKGPADANVAASLYHRACGYSHPDLDIRTLSHGLNASAELVITPITKHYPPDTPAASLWLRNRANKLWKEKNQTEVSGPGGAPIETVNSNTQYSPDEAYRMMLNKPKSE